MMRKCWPTQADFEADLQGALRRAFPYVFLFAADVSLRCLDGSVAKQKSNLFEFAAAIMAESGTGATKRMGPLDESRRNYK